MCTSYALLGEGRVIISPHLRPVSPKYRGEGGASSCRSPKTRFGVNSASGEGSILARDDPRARPASPFHSRNGVFSATDFRRTFAHLGRSDSPRGQGPQRRRLSSEYRDEERTIAAVRLASCPSIFVRALRREADDDVVPLHLVARAPCQPGRNQACSTFSEGWRHASLENLRSLADRGRIAGLGCAAWNSKAQDDDIRFLPERCPSVRGYQLLSKAFPQDVFASKVVVAIERAGWDPDKRRLRAGR